MIKKLIVASLFIAIIVTGCSPNVQTNMQKNTPLPSKNPITQPTENHSFIPDVKPTAQPLAKAESINIDELTADKAFDTLFISHWNLENNKDPFLMNGKSYVKGLGMYIAPEVITGKQASLSAAWNLEKKYNKISFDIGCEESMDYDIADKFGQFKITIFADGKELWDSELRDYQYAEENVEVLLPKDCERMEIKLNQIKGSEGTLKIVLGNFKLYKNQEQ